MEVCKIIISGTITRHYGSQLLYSQLMSVCWAIVEEYWRQKAWNLNGLLMQSCGEAQCM